MTVAVLKFTLSDDHLRSTGLLGWARVSLDGTIVIDALALRRTRSGRLSISWPRKPNGHSILRPRDEVARHEIERQFLEAIAPYLKEFA